MTPEQQIADLDMSLRLDGEDIILRRRTQSGGTFTTVDQVTVRASVRVRSAQMTEDTISQQTYEVVISPTQIIADGWPAGASGSIDTRVPLRGDVIEYHGRLATIVSARPVYRDGTLVRIAITAEGP